MVVFFFLFILLILQENVRMRGFYEKIGFTFAGTSILHNSEWCKYTVDATAWNSTVRAGLSQRLDARLKK